MLAYDMILMDEFNVQTIKFNCKKAAAASVFDYECSPLFATMIYDCTQSV